MAEENKHNEAVRGIANDDLLGKWRTFSLDNSDENMGEFLTALVDNATLLMVVLADQEIKTDEQGRAKLDQDVQMQFPLMSSQDRQNIQPLFTDWQEVNTLFDNWDKSDLHQNVEKASILPISFSDLAQLLAQNDGVDGIAINPFSDNIFFSRQTVADLAKQQQQHHAANNEVKVAVSEPQNLPAGFEDALRTELSPTGVKQAWLRVISYDGTEHLVLILDAESVSEQALSPLAQKLGSQGDALLKEADLQLSVVPLDDDSRPMVEGIAPFFRA
ncbi:enhanced serine sensitivity protein SseB C-terminal domain-containing protein [Lacticaseibacillus jixianensis]|uniref:Enhanced serine sensitivity protein SseB C-terminal domain-containing protein n=1 Tax=Lacticaseibacillus jixianensis TaxID=2486012 RepID=A0ABW4B9N4_9LACO|nr:enhanced serine sensitivity protein SseB C-terminal domain-containing protein [Lacticaseibacillus jixianensis]